MGDEILDQKVEEVVEDQVEETPEEKVEEKVEETPEEKVEEKEEDKPDEKKEEDKPDEKKEEDKGDDKEDEPEKYELKLSEDSILKDEDLARISDYASEKGLTKEQAEERLALEESSAKRGAEIYGLQQQEVLEAEQERWIEAAKADKEIGGDNFVEASELSRRVLEKFGSKEFVEGLDKSKLGNYHELVRFTYRIGKAMDSDKLIIGDENNKQPKSIAERLYGNDKKE